MSLQVPPPTHEEIVPYNDLTGQVVMTEDTPFMFGGFSDIYRGAWTDPRTNTTRGVAIKILRARRRDPETHMIMTRHFNRETRVWHALSHENILEFFGISNDFGFIPAMISPLCDEGRIMRYLQNNPEADRAQLIFQIAKGLEYLHSKNILHGDLKSPNVLIDDQGNPLLSSFGRSRIHVETDFNTLFAGTRRYLAPESILTSEDGFTPVSTKEADVYGFGGVGFEILTGKMPLHTTHEISVIHRLVEFGLSNYEIRYPPEYEGTWKVIEKCWAQDPTSRPIISDVVRRLSSI